MPVIRSSRFLTFGGLVIIFCAVAGGFWGRSALVAQDQIPDQYKVFTSALGAIEENYVGDYESDRLVYSAITGLLQTLDPHSSFMDPRSFAQMRERQEGRYYGLGITINVVDGDVTIFTVFEGSPAHQKGLRRGDVFAKIEGEDAKGWTSEQAVSRLRGPKQSSVKISIRRAGIRRAHRSLRHARRSAYPDRAGRRDARRHDRLHQAAGLWRKHRPGTGSCARDV